MTQDLRRNSLPLRWTTRLGIAMCTICIGTAALLYGWTVVERMARQRVVQAMAQLSRRLGTPVQVGRIDLSPVSLTLEDLRLGPEAQIVISHINAELNINLFGPALVELNEIDVADLRVKMTEDGLRSLAAGEGDGGKSAEAPAAKLERLVQKTLTSLPSRHLVVSSAQITVLEPTGEPSLQLQGLRLAVDKGKAQVLFRLDRIKAAQGINERLLYGRLELSPTAKDYRFFIKSKATEADKTNLWSGSGAVARDLNSLQLTASFRRRPNFVQTLLKDQPLTVTRLRSRLVADLTRQGTGWQFNAQVQSFGSTIKAPLLSSQELGPLYFELKTSGSYQRSGRNLVIDAATLSLPSRISRSYGERPVRFSGRMAAALSGGSNRSFALKGQITLPETPCQDLIEASPHGLLPALEGFKLDGGAAATVAFDLTSRNPETGRFSLDDAVFNCNVREAPYAFSAERLSGPLLVERRVDTELEPLVLNLDREAPGYASIPLIGKNAQVAFVSSEDAAFYLHKGIDAAALVSALRRDLAEGRVAAGGSTITMQTVKNIFLSPERTVARKVQELFLSWHLERTLSKERILELYMNVAELGPGIYGISSAAEHFFAKPAADLTLLESAYLATLLPSPKVRYRYFCKGDLTPNYRELVHGLLRRMLSLGRISPERFQQAVHSTLRFNAEQRFAAKACVRPDAAESKGESAFLLRRSREGRR